MQTEKWVVIRLAWNDAEARIIKGVLESADIPVLTEQEAIGKFYGITTDGLGRIKLLVPESCRKRAEALLPE